MKEHLVSYETAKLALEKGYVGKIGLGYKYNTGNYYNAKGELNGDCTDLVREIYNARNSDVKPLNSNISAPTQSLLQKWLREKYDIEIQIFTMGIFMDKSTSPHSEFKLAKGFKKYEYGLNANKPQLDMGFETYEEALEKGLYEALKLIE